MVKITKSYITKGSKNRPALSNPKTFITIHNTGNTSKGSGAKNHASYANSVGAKAVPVSWHYTVDDKEIYMHLPEEETAYHAGDGSGDGNKKSIGIEICMNVDGDITKATDNAIELVADICKRNNIPVCNIKQHYDWSKKNCPQLIRKGVPYSWATFIGKVNQVMKDPQPINPQGKPLYRVRAGWKNSDTQEGAFNDLKNAQALADKLNSAKVYFVYDSDGNIVSPI